MVYLETLYKIVLNNRSPTNRITNMTRLTIIYVEPVTDAKCT